MRSFISFIVLTAVAAAATAHGAQPAKAPVPVMVEADDTLDACGVYAVVDGLKPGGDGFLAVRSGPGADHAQVDKLLEGVAVHICGETGDFYGVVYARGEEDCGVSTPRPTTAPYAGPCRSGWAHRRWIKPVAG